MGKLSEETCFCKECAFYDQCEIENAREYGHNIVIFKCPRNNRTERWYKSDFGKIRTRCKMYVPRQQDLKDYL